MRVVVKMGDRVVEKATSRESLSDLELIEHDNPTVIVHGGGNTVTRMAERLGVEQKFVTSPEGFRSRYTDAETIEIYTMVMAGKINKEIVRRLQERKLPGIGLSGIDGALISAERKKKLIVQDERGRRRAIEGGYTGRITRVNDTLLNSLLSSKYLPVIAPIALGTNFEPLNIDGDRTAASIAAAIHADLLVLLTDVNGVSIEGARVRTLRSSEAKEILPKIGPGMSTKLYAATEALSMGVRKVVIVRGDSDTPYTSAVNENMGTVIC